MNRPSPLLRPAVAERLSLGARVGSRFAKPESMNSSSGHDTGIREVLTASELKHSIEYIVSRWDAPSAAHAQFRAWACEVAHQLSPEAADFAERVSELRAEFRQVHQALAHTLVACGHVDEALVSRRSFVARLLDAVAPFASVSSSPSRVTFVRTAA